MIAFMRVAVTAAALGLCALAGGCYSVQTATSPVLSKCALSGDGGEIVEHVFAANEGWFLFYHLPIICGDTDKNAVLPVRFFHDEVTKECLWKRLGEYAREKGLRVVRPADGSLEDVTFDVPGFSVPVVLPFILCYRQTQVSALLVKDNPAKGEEAAK